MNFYSVINGKEYKTEEMMDIISPWNLKSCGKVSKLNSKDIDLAFDIASKSQKEWKQIILSERIIILRRWSKLIVENSAEMAKLMMEEIGKSYKDSLKEIQRSVEYFNYSLEEAKRIHPQTYRADSWGHKTKVGFFSYVPLGVILAISPFNYPINLSISKIIPALVMGNSVVLKPATNGSMSALFLAKLSIKANLPPGIFNVVTGLGRDIGSYLISNRNISLISFTGSVKVGKNILAKANCKNIILELGGKDPAIILDDQNLNSIAKEIIEGAFGYSGQRCTAIKRVITTNKIAKKLVPILKKEVLKLTINKKHDGFISPLISLKAANYVMELIQDALTQKAELIIGNKAKSNLVSPTIIDHVTEDMKLAWDEPFGPVLPIIRIDNIPDMIELINKSKFGLQASIFSQNLEQAFNLASYLEVGTVNINGKSQRGPDSFPFLGVKDSGLGVQGIRETLLSSVRIKGLVINYKDISYKKL